MGKFCKSHCNERTSDELRARLQDLTARPGRGPKLKLELERVMNELLHRDQDFGKLNAAQRFVLHCLRP